MPPVGFVTKVGSTADVRPSGPDVVLAMEPDIGATLRTKGRLYLICAGEPAGAVPQIAREIAELVRDEYYHDLSAGIEVSLRRALRAANRRAAQRLRDQRGHPALHAACAVIVNNEMYAARVGSAQVFLVRRARLFLPGDEAGELADFVHRTTPRETASLGGDIDVLPKVWRQSIEAQDTVILASGALVEGLGADALKNAAVTLHPRAAAEHIHNRAVADGITGSDAIAFIEISQAQGAAARMAPEAARIAEPAEVVIAETIRSRFDAIWRHRPRPGALVRAATAPAADALSKGVAVGLELMPRRGAELPRHPDTARSRSRRQRRAVTTLALLLMLAALGVGGLAYRDYESTRAGREYQLAILAAEDAAASAHRLAERKPPDADGARERIVRANARLDEAERFPAAERERIAAVRVDLVALEDRLDGVILDLARAAPGAKPTQLLATSQGLYVVDVGAGRLWRVWSDPLRADPVLTKGTAGVGTPSLLSVQGDVLYAVDDAHRLWRAEGNQVRDVSPDGRDQWKTPVAMAVFIGNLYVLDGASGQLFKHESNDGVAFDAAASYLSTPVPPNTARSLAVDGDVWIVTTANEILRFRRNPLERTAARADFTPKWQGDAARPAAIQALQAQSAIYVLDPGGRRVVQMARDGRELARYALSPMLPEPTAFYVSEGQRVAYTLHGTKIVATSLDR